jgi:sugar phosphate isomerase/epimerase
MSYSHHTRTGSFPIGFRRGGSEWQKDLPALLAWAKNNRIGVIDLGRDAGSTAETARRAGFRIGSADLLVWQDMLAADAGRRKEAVEQNTAYIRAATQGGGLNFFTVMLPADKELPRSENFGYMVDSFGQLASVLQATGSKVVVEGWPGPGALCCTPEGCRALLKELPGSRIGLNYDPSHLVRMGIDPLRFLREFAPHVYHVHGKDTQLYPEALYEYGNLQPATFAKGHKWGDLVWRYTLPGQGVVSWTEVFRILQDAGYAGAVSVELEDENFNGTPEGEKLGLLQSVQFLAGC